jgi:hypothetical protein
LSGVRQELTAWLPPEPELGFTIVQKSVQKPVPLARSAPWWVGPVPVWAQAAAAMLVLATGVAIANVQVRYDAQGVTVSTGWLPVQTPPQAQPAAASSIVPTSGAHDQEWRTALAALERDMRQEMQAMAHGGASASVPVAFSETGASDAALVRRMQNLVTESERRQRQEVALRLTQFGRELEGQRRADLVRIEQGMWQFQGRTGAEVARQREMLNSLVRVSGRQVIPE